MTEYCSRMTIQPADVAKAKELFVEKNEVESGEDWLLTEEEQDEEDGEEENMEAEVDTSGSSNDDEHDDALIYDDDDDDEAYNDEEVYIDEERYPQNNGYTPKFDRVFPPVGEIVHLSDAQLRKWYWDH